jgi:hypothetical protein
MGIDCFSARFAAEYGLRDALILSEICAAAQYGAVTQYGGDGAEGTSGPELGRRFTYLTKEQIREALQSLKRKGLISGRRIQGEFTREIRYIPGKGVLQEYLQDIVEDRIPSVVRLPRARERDPGKAARGRKKGG